MTISFKKHLAYLQQAIYNNNGYFMGQKEAVPIDGTWIKIMRSGTEKQWLLPALIVLRVPDILVTGSKLSSSATVMAELQTITDMGIVVIPAQIEQNSYMPAMVDKIGQTPVDIRA